MTTSPLCLSLQAAPINEWGLTRLECFDQVDSTQNILRKLADEGAPEWTIVVADHQMSGRGQHGRTWQGESGASLTFSVLLRPGTPGEMGLIPIRTGLAVASVLGTFLEPTTDSSIQLKWPNDLIVDGRKLGGILSEGQMRGDELVAIVGIGVNVRPFELTTETALEATFLEEWTGKEVPRFDLLRSIAISLHTRLDAAEPELTANEIREYNDVHWLHGELIREPIAGSVRGIDPTGRLVVEREGGEIVRLVSGTVRRG